MNDNQFSDALFRELQTIAADNQEIERITVPKNNGVMREALSLRFDGEEYAAVLYLDALYTQFCKEDVSVHEFAETLLSTRFPAPWRDYDLLTDFSDFNAVRDRVFLRLISTERNLEFLKHAPARPFMDLSLTCCMILNESPYHTMEEATGCIRITNDFLTEWDIDEETLFTAARENTLRKERPSLVSMRQIFTLPSDADVPEMYILSNHSKRYGATVMTYEGVMEKIAEKLGGDFVLLPSCVHEMIVVSADEICCHADILKMIREINAQEVDPEEVLSDSYYRYLRSENRLMLCE